MPLISERDTNILVMIQLNQFNVHAQSCEATSSAAAVALLLALLLGGSEFSPRLLPASPQLSPLNFSKDVPRRGIVSRAAARESL